MRWTQLIDHPVVDRSTAETVGKVASAIVDPDGPRLTALVVAGADGAILDWDDVPGIGEDAVVVDGAGTVRAADGEAEERAVERTLDPIGKQVLDDAGDLVGELVDLTIDADSGALEVLMVRGLEEPMPADRLLGVGGHSVVVRASSSGDDGRRTGSGSSDLASMSKAELYERAQDADVPGRSSMTKDELIEALRS